MSEHAQALFNNGQSKFEQSFKYCNIQDVPFAITNHIFESTTQKPKITYAINQI